MDSPPPQRLSDFSTCWTLLRAAHDAEADPTAREQARQALVERYLGVARSYLGGALRHEANREDVVEELAQEFGVKVMAGSLQNASPDGGKKFRVYLRTVLANLVNEWHRKRRRREIPLPSEPLVARDVSEQEYATIWREELVRRALQALAEYEQRTGEVRYLVLKLAIDHPTAHTSELAERLSVLLGKPVDAAWVRKRTFLAREKLRELVRHEVRQTLREPTDEAVEEELAEAGLLKYCR